MQLSNFAGWPPTEDVPKAMITNGPQFHSVFTGRPLDATATAKLHLEARPRRPRRWSEWKRWRRSSHHRHIFVL